MTPDRWTQIERLLDEALALDPDERDAFLDEACPDPDLRREVDALLEADANAPAFLEDDAAEFAAPALAADPDENDAVTGQRIGPYRLDEAIGYGGMSVVYRAERDDGQFRQQVAIKLLRYLGGDPEAQRRRFQAEQQILATLSHPHIAQVFDGGVTTSDLDQFGGQPYLVMEYVDGEPITDYCRRQRCSLEERLALFDAVCEAVQHAHQRLIIHRDLKPSNILVREGDSGAGPGQAQVKLLDFGIAKLLDAQAMDLPQTAPLTRTGLRLLTPEYAAPEQVRGEAVTTATDVYALGVVLYELLTGQRPYDLTDKTPSEVERIVCEQAVTKPSTALTATGSAAPKHHVEPQRLRGDLDVIVMKALRKEPDARYGSVQELADDLRRYREGLPVQARPATAGYRVRKFVRRHRLGVAMATAVTVLLVGFVVALAVQQRATARERDRAQAEAAKAQEVSAFLADLFVASDPWEEVQGDTLRARDLLDRGAARIETELADAPEVQATMMQTIGTVYQRLGDYDEAERLLEKAHAVQRDHLDEEHPEIARSLRTLSELRYDQGDFAAAESLAHAALEIDRASFGDDHPRVANDLFLIGLARQDQGDFAAAESLHQQALAIRRTLPDRRDEQIAKSLHELARATSAQGDYAAAESLEYVALDITRRIYGENHPRVAQGLNNVAYLARRRGNYAEAEARYRDAIAIKRSTLGPTHPTLAETLSNLGILIGIQGRYEESEAVLQEALAIRRARYGSSHPRVAYSLHSLAMLKLKTGDLVEAISLAEDVLDMLRATVGDAHPRVAGTLDLIGHLHYRRNDFAEAERYFRDALDMERRFRGEEHETVALRMNNLASALIEQKRYAKAEPLLREAIAINRRMLGPEHLETGNVMRNLGRLLGHTDRHAEGEAVLLKALAIQEEALGAEHPRLRQTRQYLVDLYDAWGKTAEAEKYRVLITEAEAP